MNLFKIARKEVRHGLRDWHAAVVMILFPIVVTAILGTALSGAFGGSSLPATTAVYTVASPGPLATAFDHFRETAAKAGLTLVAAPDEDTAIAALREARYAGVIRVDADGLRLSRNDRYPTQAAYLESLLAAFVSRYSTLEVTGPRDGARVPTGAAVNEVSLTAAREPGAMDYYGVSIVTAIVLYSSLFGMASIRREWRLGTGARVLSAPVRPLSLLGGKILGTLALTVLQVAVLMLFGHAVLGADWGSDLVTVAAVLLSMAVLSVALGVGAAYLIPAEGAANGVLNTLIPLLATLGGSYVPLEVMGPAMAKIAAYNPVGLVNRALFGVIYAGDYTAVIPAIGVALGVAALLLTPAALGARKEAA